jgi:hypothetical protein
MKQSDIKKRMDKLLADVEKAEFIYQKLRQEIRNQCEHDFERFSDYAGTDYCCKKCGEWK